MRIMMKRISWLFLLLLCLLLTGCRTRTTVAGRDARESASETAQARSLSVSGSLPEESEAEEQKKDGEPGGQTKENPEASRKEYDENAPAEIVSGAERSVQGNGEGNGASAAKKDAAEAAQMLNEAAEETASQTIAAEQAEQAGVSEDAKEADSALTYYTVLLRDRMGSLYECQRLNVYWETPEDHVTVFKTSPEHELILNAGAYDVSARLLAGNLRVDDGWIARKNPGVIVKIVRSDVLGAGVSSPAAAQAVYAGLLAREGWRGIDAVRNGRVLMLSEELLQAPYLQTAAMLMIAKAANPEALADVDIEKALSMLMEEATGSIPAGIYDYSGQGGI